MGPDADRPAVLAYDGSPSADAALRAAVPLFGSRLLLVAIVWEAGMASRALAPMDSSMSGLVTMPVDPETIIEVDRAESDHAARVAQAGVDLVRELGGSAEPVVLDDEADTAATLVTLARDRDAAVMVIGSHGHGGFRDRMLGSTSQRLLRHAPCPVLVVHQP